MPDHDERDFSPLEVIALAVTVPLGVILGIHGLLWLLERIT